MNRKLFLAGGILWIAGLVLSIVGLNLEGGVRSALSVAGNIVFLVGLGIPGAVWLRARNREASRPEEPAPGHEKKEP